MWAARAGTFAVFDYVADSVSKPYDERMTDLEALYVRDEIENVAGNIERFSRVDKILPVKINSLVELQAYEERCLSEGYEGVMIRTPNSPYKCGRSTENEGFLLKIKRFEDAEAVVLDCYEGLTNQNAAEKDAFGRTKRSTAQAGMVGRGELGGFVVRVLDSGVEFRLGYNQVLGGVDRVTLWQQREALVGKLIKFKHQPSGAKEAPRFPKFIGFREVWDL